MNGTKYICFEVRPDNSPEEYPSKQVIITFPAAISHLSMQRAMAYPPKTEWDHEQLSLSPVSAGFVIKGNDGIPVCYGRSTSLGLSSREREDTILLRSQY